MAASLPADAEDKYSIETDEIKQLMTKNFNFESNVAYVPTLVSNHLKLNKLKFLLELKVNNIEPHMWYLKGELGGSDAGLN